MTEQQVADAIDRLEDLGYTVQSRRYTDPMGCGRRQTLVEMWLDEYPEQSVTGESEKEARDRLATKFAGLWR